MALPSPPASLAPACSQHREGRAWRSAPRRVSGPAGSGRHPIPRARIQSRDCQLQGSAIQPWAGGGRGVGSCGRLAASLPCFSWSNCKAFTVDYKTCSLSRSIKSDLQNSCILLQRSAGCAYSMLDVSVAEKEFIGLHLGFECVKDSL